MIALVVASSVYTLGLQCARMMVHPDEVWHASGQTTWLDVVAFLASTAFLQIGLALFCFGFLLLQRARRVRSGATAALQLFTLTLLVVETAAQSYFYATGQTLDWPLFVESVAHPAQVVTLGGGAVPREVWAALLTCALLVAGAPWLASRRARRQPADRAALERRRPLSLALCLLGPGVVALGFLTGTEAATDAAAPRDPVLNLLATAFPVQRRPAAFGAADPRIYFRVEIEPLPQPPGTPPTTPRNVVLVMLESTRASATSLYPPFLGTTPFLKELQAKSLVVERMQAVIPATKKAIRHILCGFEASHSIRPQALTLGVMTRCLPALLRERGWSTVFFQTAEEHFDHRVPSAFSMGFSEFLGPSSYDHQGYERPNYLGWEDESMLPPSRDWLRRHRKKPFLAAYLTVDPHHECRPMTRLGQLTYTGKPEFDCYLNAIRYQDQFLRALIRQYEELGLLGSTVFVVVGDHGEAFGEHGRRVHNDVPWQEALHVPALIYDPAGRFPRPGTLPGSWAQTDLAPTLVELLGFRPREGAFQGRSLLQPAVPNRVIYSACYGEEACLVSLWGSRKYIHHFGRKRDELFDLQRDPLEQVNLASARPQECDQRREEVLAWDDQLRAHYAWFELHRDAPLPLATTPPRR